MHRYMTIAFYVLLLLITGCKKKTRTQLFIDRYHLEQYDTLYIISCFSCGGCIEEYQRSHFPQLPQHKGILIFDEHCPNKFIGALTQYKHLSVPQSSLDSAFNNFGNIVLIVRDSNNNYITTTPFD